MSKFKVGDRVLMKGRNVKGTVFRALKEGYLIDSDLNQSGYDYAEDDNLVRLVPKKDYKYVLKTQLLDDVYPKNHEKYVKVRVLK